VGTDGGPAGKSSRDPNGGYGGAAGYDQLACCKFDR
jgi:hypothetical protein